MEAKYGNNILYVSILFCCGCSSSTSCATDLDRLRLCINCPYKNSQRSYGRPRKNAYLEICWLDSAFKIFQQFKYTGSAGVLIWVQVRSSLLRRFESSRRSLRNLYSIWCPIFGSLLQGKYPLQICLFLDQGILPFKTESAGTAGSSQKMMHHPPIACFQSQRLKNSYILINDSDNKVQYCQCIQEKERSIERVVYCLTANRWYVNGRLIAIGNFGLNKRLV